MVRALIRNRRNNVEIKDLYVFNSPLSKISGLMFRKKGRALFIFNNSSKEGVWTPFMKFSIDLIFIDETLRIVEIKRNLKPWRIYRPEKKYRYFIEVESNRSMDFEVGDELEIILIGKN